MRKASCCFIFLLILTTQAANVLADTYSWKDENGTIHFTDKPENIPPKYRQIHRVQKNNTVKNTSPEHRQSQKNLSKIPLDIIPGAQGKNLDFAETQKLAEQGDSDAQESLGVMYSVGQRVPKDDVKAAEWFRKAAEQGNVKAQFFLGGMYAMGQGVPRDMTKAAEWFRKAAEQGNDYGQLSLGYMYDIGHGVPRSPAKAAEWYRKAAEQGNTEAQNMFNMHDGM